MSRELLKLAFEAIERGVKDGYWNKDTVDVSTRIQKYLAEQPAQPQQEPVAYRSRIRNRDGQVITAWVVHLEKSKKPSPRYEIESLYTTPPTLSLAQRKPWVGLTDEEAIFLIENELLGRCDLIEAIEAKLKEKNT